MTSTKQRKDIVILLDESGSMKSMESEPLESVNIFIKDQKELIDNSTITIYTFNTKVKEVCKDVELKDYGTFTEFSPNGMTSLYDAIGTCIENKEKTNDVYFLIITDGQDNSSSKYTKQTIKKMIKNTEEELNWTYLYLGANQDSYSEGGSIGISNCVNFDSMSVNVSGLHPLLIPSLSPVFPLSPLPSLSLISPVQKINMNLPEIMRSISRDVSIKRNNTA